MSNYPELILKTWEDLEARNLKHPPYHEAIRDCFAIQRLESEIEKIKLKHPKKIFSNKGDEIGERGHIIERKLDEIKSILSKYNLEP